MKGNYKITRLKDTAHCKTATAIPITAIGKTIYLTGMGQK